jgi:hypothetical protein
MLLKEYTQNLDDFTIKYADDDDEDDDDEDQDQIIIENEDDFYVAISNLEHEALELFVTYNER